MFAVSLDHTGLCSLLSECHQCFRLQGKICLIKQGWLVVADIQVMKQRLPGSDAIIPALRACSPYKSSTPLRCAANRSKWMQRVCHVDAKAVGLACTHGCQVCHRPHKSEGSLALLSQMHFCLDGTLMPAS